jgi:hypothetical protein
LNTGASIVSVSPSIAKIWRLNTSGCESGVHGPSPAVPPKSTAASQASVHGCTSTTWSATANPAASATANWRAPTGTSSLTMSVRVPGSSGAHLLLLPLPTTMTRR